MSVPPLFKISAFVKVPGFLYGVMPAVKKMFSALPVGGGGLGTANLAGPPTKAGPVPCAPTAVHELSQNLIDKRQYAS